MEIDESLLDLDYQPFVTELEQKLISIQKSMVSIVSNHSPIKNFNF